MTTADVIGIVIGAWSVAALLVALAICATYRGGNHDRSTGCILCDAEQIGIWVEDAHGRGWKHAVGRELVTCARGGEVVELEQYRRRA